MYTVMDTLDCLDFDSTLVMVKPMCAEYSNIIKIKEDLESTNKAKAQLSDKLEKSEDDRKALLLITKEISLDFDTCGHWLQKEVVDLKKEYNEKRKRIEEWELAVNPSYDKISTLLPMGEEHGSVCPTFALVYEEYCKKYEFEPSGEDNV